ncbi:MAG: acyltransferase family protein [Gallionella sp.]
MSLPVPAGQTRLAHPKYRADIDGLRAVAVLSVIGFHAFPAWVKGGFVGVDIFFVISGFLISSIIMRNLETGTFSFTEFYARRIKRIFPALILIMAACFAFGWFVLLPDEYMQLGKHIAAGAGFVSNLVFWQEAGYFDNAAQTKPLLHLWSLGIEEQFYIVWPFLLWFAWKLRSNLLVIAMVVAAISFMLNIEEVDRNSVAAFYSPQTRFWELMAGSILSYMLMHRQNMFVYLKNLSGISTGRAESAQSEESKLKMLRNGASISGAALIAIGVLITVKDRQTPGWWALLPTVGALLVIWAGAHAWLNRVVLSHRVLVWFGLISYPLYLWHWPLLSFARIIESGVPSPGFRTAAIFISIALAWLTYKFIERPIRFARPGNSRAIALFVSMILMGYLGFNAYSRDGLPFRSDFKERQNEIDGLNWDTSKFIYFKCPDKFQLAPPRLEFCLLTADGAPTYAIFGDSHAAHLIPGLIDMDKSNSWLFVGRTSCPPVSGIDVSSSSAGNCEQVSEKALGIIDNISGIHTVVLSFWGNYMLDLPYAKDHILKNPESTSIQITSKEFLTTDKKTLFYLGLESTVKELESHGKSVIVIIDIPELPFLPRDCLRPAPFGGGYGCKLSAASVLNRQYDLRVMLNRLVEAHPNVRLYDPIGLFCEGENCRYEKGDNLLYRDSQHLSVTGSDLVVDDFLKWLPNNRTRASSTAH